MTEAADPSPAVPRLFTNPRVWAWAAVLASAAVCLVLFWMSRQHKQVVDETTAAVTALREARVDLAKGLLYVTLGSDPASSFDREQGLALLAQAADGLDQATRPTGGRADDDEASGLAVFRASLQAFRGRLTRSIRGTGPAGDAALRPAFYDLERQADQADARILAQLTRHSEQTDRTFALVLGMAAILLSVVCAGIFIAGREQNRAMTALQESERALRDERNRFAALTETAPTAVYSFNIDAADRWSFPYASPRMADLYGLPPAELDAAAVEKRTHPDDMVRLLATIDQSRRLLSAWHEEFRIEHPVRGEMWVEGHSMPVRGADGSTTWHGTLTDITRRKQGEMAVQERLAIEERLSRLAATSPGVMYEFQLRPDGTMSFPFASDRIRDLFGVRADEVAGDAAPVMARVHPDDAARVRQIIEASGRTMTVWTDSFRYDHPDRGVIWVEGRAAPTRHPDGSVRWHGFLLDVTDRRLLEDQYRQSQKMEAIGLLAGGIAHDFNNLLTVILGHVSTLPSNGDDTREAAREIEGAAERAAALTRQLLLFSRKQVMRPVKMDLNDAVANVTRLLQRIIGEDVVLHAQFTPGLPLVLADPGMLEQVLLNLAVNSRDAMPGGGQLELSTGTGVAGSRMREQHPGAGRGPFVSLSVRDTGAGIAPEILPRIFEPFFTTKEAGKGTGLGLATAYGIIKQHRGWITVESEPGRGTTFTVCLPALTREVVRPASVTPRTGRPVGTETVLVVEDEPSVRLLTASVLERSGYTVLTAVSGVAALEVWREHESEIALVVTDMVMPEGVTGPELARRLRALRPDVKVLFTSGYTAEV
ncbi:MAG: PAS domain-containing protein, partial [Acidobacteria bacterium]|nr:PAS domain-containing protein [Acidobacteriota bacterium]